MKRHSFLGNRPQDSEVETRAVNTIRLLAADAVQEANSGHPGMPMGMAQAAYTLWTRYMQFSPANPGWINRDRFVLSAGHGSMLLYALLHLHGYDLSLDDLRDFRQWGSKTPGHPERGHTPGVETTTGPLGQGFANGIGMAIAERWHGARFNRPGFTLIDHYIYAVVSDGDLMEGISSEAASIAGHLQLGKVIYLYDDNHITIDGTTAISYSENWAKRFDAYGWHVQAVDGNNAAEISAAIEAAQADPRPSIIGCRTQIGYGSPKLAGTSKIHGAPLGDDELAATRAHLGFPEQPRFHVPDDVRRLFEGAVSHGRNLTAEHDALLEQYAAQHPQSMAELRQFLSGELAEGWEEAIPSFVSGGSMATRNAGGEVINAIAAAIPNLVGGSADLAGSTKTTISGSDFLSAEHYTGQNMHFGVREHGMAGILNGMYLYGGLRPFGGTFLVFSDYMRGSMRLAAIMGVPVIYVLTHDGIGVGEDGPTHQPIEQIAALRAMPNMTVLRPADANETAQAWRAALLNDSGPTVLALTRQNLPIFPRDDEHHGSAEGVLRGAYVLYENAPKGLDIILIGGGSEVEIAYDAGRQLAAEGVGVRVVSFAAWELFKDQGEAYQAQILPAGVPKLAIEAGVTFGWQRWVGNDPALGDVIGLDRYGASAPYAEVYEKLGLTVEHMLARARSMLADATT